MLDDMEIQALILGARQAREAAYAPYSKYKVGAAVVAYDDRVFFGCNIENSSYGLSICAERAAIAAAITAGVTGIRAAVIVTECDPPATPCGACRQWMAEFGSDCMEVICAGLNGKVVRTTLGKLLPDAFGLGRK